LSRARQARRKTEVTSARAIEPQLDQNAKSHVGAIGVMQIMPTTYLRNIYKYYAAYKLTLDVRQEQQKAREQIASPGKP
jgi:hypothetical protein